MLSRIITVVVVMFVATTVLAQDGSSTTVNVGSGLASQLRDIMVTVVAGVATAFFGWMSYWVKQKFGIDIEAKHREALTAFITRQASGLIASGAVKLEGVSINVRSEALASAARLALTAVPDAMGYFNLTPQAIGEMIVDLIPKQPSVAAAQAVALDVKNPQTPEHKSK